MDMTFHDITTEEAHNLIRVVEQGDCICACNWFVSQATDGTWIHQDGAECGLKECDAKNPCGEKKK